MAEELQSLEKSLVILEAIGRAPNGSLRAVAEALSLPFSTVHRITGALIDNGYVLRQGRGSYTLGPAILSLAANSSLPAMLAHVARPITADLARQCRATIHLGILDSDMITYLVKQPFGRHRVLSVEGMQLEAYCSAVGKILLSDLPGVDADRYLATDDFVPLTPRTITEPARLAAELDIIRKRGWALDDEEITAGLRCVAVAIRDPAGTAIAALSASGPAPHMTDDRIEAMVPHLDAAAQRVAAQLYPARRR